MQASKDWGKHYESWEFQGEAGAFGAESVRAFESRPSRCDLAWDFECRDDCTPDHVADSVEAHSKAVGLTLGIAGQGGRNTRYVGSARSERRIRVYRKDWEDEAYAKIYGPTMRIELIIKGAYVRMWWPIWKADTVRGWEAGVGHVYEMIGHLVERSHGEVPRSQVEEAVSESVRLERLLTQHASWLVAYQRAGIPIMELAEKREKESTSRVRKHRLNRRIEEIERSGLREMLDACPVSMEEIERSVVEYERFRDEAVGHPESCFCPVCREA